jgi:HPt (histidine-containing phosphotransfer) domain-containing protein
MARMTATTTLAPLDRAHLKRMTMGDAALAREVLVLFERQAASIVERMGTADAKARGEMAHALKGSARGIGAWQVAEAAAQVERDGAPALALLRTAVTETRSEIARLTAQSMF